MHAACFKFMLRDLYMRELTLKLLSLLIIALCCTRILTIDIKKSDKKYECKESFKYKKKRIICVRYEAVNVTCNQKYV